MSDSLFDIDAFRDRMSPGSFASGIRMVETGVVDLVSIEDEVVTAYVQGGDLYLVELRPPADGACTCPAFEKEAACKHQVGVAAAVNGLSTTDLQRIRQRMARLRDSLALESKDALIERIVDLAKRDPKVLTGLER